MANLSQLLVEVATEDPMQLEAGETPEQWAASMMGSKSPAGRMKKSVLTFMSAIESAEGPAVEKIRAQLRELIE